MEMNASPSGSDLRFRKRRIRVLTHSLWILSLPVFALLGYLGREMLASQGVSVLPDSKSIRLFAPYATLHILAVFICSFCIRDACFKAFEGEENRLSTYLLRVIDPSVDPASERDFPKLQYSIFGACIGIALAFSASLFAGVVATGPGGFAEVVIMELAMFPLTLGYLLFAGLVAAAIGGFIGGRVFDAVAG